MKKLLFAVLIFAACNPAKIATVSAPKLSETSSGFVFENDTVKIQYRFWNNKGRMEYDIYNKLSEPIYIDWKTSAYIPNDKMVSYYRDETNAEMTSSSYYVLGRYNGGGIAKGKSQARHQERIAVIPPQAMITQKDYSLIQAFDDLPKNGDYNTGNSPLVFRNYVAISNNERFDGKSSYINNSFFISKIVKSSGSKYEKYKSPTAFYVVGSNTAK